MTLKHLYLLLIAIIAIGAVVAQNEDELQIPVENDNQFPPDKHLDSIDGSGDGVIDAPGDIDETVTEAPLIPIKHVQTNLLLEDTSSTTTEGDNLCPKPCVCRIEGSSNDFIVDCSGYELTELPTPINEEATILYLQNNKLTEIPKEISNLKKLKILNANDNSITDLASGSISELPELTTLKLRNNRLIEYPHDLKNSFGLTKLEELDLGGNDMRTELTPDIFTTFEALRTIILPPSKADLPLDLCKALPIKLENVCIDSCENKLFACQDDGEAIEDELPVIPGMLPPIIDDDDETEPSVSTPKAELDIDEKEETQSNGVTTETTSNTTNIEFSFRSAVNKQPSDVALHNAIVEAPKDATSDSPVKVGATTSDTKTGGVDKSIIGLIVAGMVVIVAVITIKKNWSSIKNRLSSNNRTPNERNNDANANGTTPEEVPLQDKSPV